MNDLFELVGFPRRDHSRLELALENSHRVVWIKSAKQTRFQKLGQCVGIARVTSDGHLCATIWDVAVLPFLQRAGLGRGLMERVLMGLVEDDIPLVALFAEPGVVKMYEKFGFKIDPGQRKGIAFQRKGTAGSALVAAATKDEKALSGTLPKL